MQYYAAMFIMKYVISLLAFSCMTVTNEPLRLGVQSLVNRS